MSKRMGKVKKIGVIPLAFMLIFNQGVVSYGAGVSSTTPHVKLELIREDGSIQNTTDVNFADGIAGEYLSEIINPAPIIKAESKVNVTINMDESALSKAPEYQIISVPDGTTPALPVVTGTWNEVGKLNGVKVNETTSYPDYVTTGGYLTTQHYNYRYGYTGDIKATPTASEIFKDPIGDPVQQMAQVNSNNQYYNGANYGAFFAKSYTDIQEMTATFVAPQTASYWFAIRTSSSASGTIDGNVFVNEWQGTNAEGWYPKAEDEGKNYYRDTGLTKKYFKLNKGQTYTIKTRWRHGSEKDYSPSLQYKTSNNENTWSNWKLAGSDVLKNQQFVGGANKAVKYWGFIQPDKTATYNLALYADDGAYGRITVGNEEIVFINSYKLSDAQNQTNNKAILLEKGKVYPLYIEWYEGCPTEKALLPTIKLAGENVSQFKPIPASWYHASTSMEPIVTTTSVYSGHTMTKEISLPDTVGYHYVIIKTVDKNGHAKQVLSGPYVIPAPIVILPVIPPIVEIPPTGIGSNSYIVPESISNLNAGISINTKSKEVKYKIDLKSITEIKLGINSVFSLDPSKIVVRIKDGANNKLIENTDYTVSKGADDVNIVLTNTIVAGTQHTIDIYIPTKLNGQVIYYGSAGSTTYMGSLKGSNITIPITVSRRPLTKEAVIVGGVTTEPEEYAATTIDTPDLMIQATLKEIPSIK